MGDVASVGAAMVGAFLGLWLLRVAWRCDRRKLLAVTDLLAPFLGSNLRSAARVVVPLAIFLIWACLIPLLQLIPDSVWLWAALAYFVGLALLGFNMLIVLWTGRPRVEVPRALRGMSEAEVGDWLRGGM
jgi:hypothetical protein